MDSSGAKRAIYYDSEPCPVIVLEGIKCGVTDRRAGDSDMGDSLRM